MIKAFCDGCDHLLFFGRLSFYRKIRKRFDKCPNCTKTLEYGNPEISIEVRKIPRGDGNRRARRRN